MAGVNSTTGVYNTFTLAGNNNGYLSITHANDSDSLELSVSEFDIQMKANQILESQTYNDSTNLSNKIFYKDIAGWDKVEDGYAFTYGETNSALTFDAVKEVIFGKN